MHLPTTGFETTPDLPSSDAVLLAGYRGGDPHAATALYRRYADRVRSLVRAKFSPALTGRLDVDDVVQSVFLQFFRAARRGAYDVPSGEGLWDLFVAITLNRLRSEERFQRAGKRDVRQTVGGDAADLTQTPAPRGGGVDAYLSTVVADALGQLTSAQRDAVRLRMDGYEVGEIAARTGRSKRTVERTLQEARARLAVVLQVGTSRDPDASHVSA